MDSDKSDVFLLAECEKADTDQRIVGEIKGPANLFRYALSRLRIAFSIR